MVFFLKNKKFLIVFGLVLFLLFIYFLVSYLLFSAPNPHDSQEKVFTISLTNSKSDIVDKLKSQGLIKNTFAFNLASKLKGSKDIQAGGYYLSKDMDIWQMLQHFSSGPEMKWVTVPEGLRKEEIGQRLQKALDWSDQDLIDWNEKYTAMKFDYLEGVYFPDTYLIPVSDKPIDVAKRFTNHFNEVFAPYFQKFQDKDMLWTTGLRFASVIQREAASKTDMPLISGILWNRLDQNMKLELDATVQYARGETSTGWWAPIKASDITDIDSPYNTYEYEGLPPHPICNPGLDAIDAVLNPETTDCLYYLHDSNRQIHCAKTYEEHLENIKEYL